MDRTQLFETTLYDEARELALAVISVPADRLEDPAGVSSPAAVLDALRLRAVAEVPPSNVGDAIAAILANEDVYEAAEWLRQPPNDVPTRLGDDVLWLAEPPARAPAARGSDPSAIGRLPSEDRLIRPPRRTQRKVSKTEPRAEELRSFGKAATAETVVPFRKSPIDFYQVGDLLEGAEAARTFLVTVRSNPLILIYFAGGFLLVSAVIGAGQGVRRGVSGGLQYRLLKKFGVPEDVIREEMRRSRSEDEESPN
jgi:hypothetical protein